jgi:hypothetical protein
MDMLCYMTLESWGLNTANIASILFFDVTRVLEVLREALSCQSLYIICIILISFLLRFVGFCLAYAEYGLLRI